MNKVYQITIASLLLLWVHLPALYAQSASDRIMRQASMALKEKRYEDVIIIIDGSQLVAEKEKYPTVYFEAMLTKVRALVELGRYDEALSNAIEIETGTKKDSRLMQLLGEIYFHIGEGSKALPYLSDSIAYNPTGDSVGRTYYQMAEIYLLQARYHQAEIALTTAVYHNPTADRWWFRLGYAREQVATLVAGSERIFLLNSAKTAYERAIQINPSNNEAKERIAVLKRSLR
ncbi:hypothetical protein PVA45_05175 [Entomospira entomophila]|uniref:Tetratricopeptide repeat protein n=1 Tax=Entomospira entomophila TaxID=2719988 RepID=A0A968KWK3_9SPIO|nr:tetratricopeptide repeat protein [Entomospira entomophilus]NIZ40890.1 hypothetical protein [Entomospira entomophilus]WDI35103.1 hypothetical protein PVA45_05175 [Entomospira entomophilus]